jgi:hypothetical protein
LITVITVSSILHFTPHENIPVLMGICSTQSMRNVWEERNKVYIIKFLINGEGKNGFYIPVAHKTLLKNAIFCSVFVIYVMEEECISRPYAHNNWPKQ